MKTKVKITTWVTTYVEHEVGELPSVDTHYADIWMKPHEGDYEDLGCDNFTVEVVEDKPSFLRRLFNLY